MISVTQITAISPPFTPPFGWLQFTAAGCLNLSANGEQHGFRASGCIEFDTQETCAEFLEQCGCGQ